MQSGLKSGWLEKRGRQLKGFHRRFFMLLRTGELWSCKDEYGKGMKVKLRLKKDRGTVTLVPRSDEDLPYDFFVEDDRGRSVYMRAGRRKDQQAWVQAFNGLLEGRDLDEIAAISGSSEPTSGGGAKTATALGVHGGRVGSGAHGSNLTASELQAGNDQVDASDEFGGAAAAAFAGLTMSQLENKSDWKTLTQHTIGLEKLGGKRHERLSSLWIQSEKTRQALQLMGDSFFRSGPAEPFTLVADASATRLLQHSFNIMERLSPTGQSGDDELDTLFKTKVTLDSLENRSTEPGAANVLYMMRPDWKEPNSKADSSELFLEDFTVGQPPFAAEKVAVLFLGPAGLRSLEKMSRCGVLRARLMCAPCVLPARHICFEGQAITMNMPTAFEDLYSSSETSGERTPFAVADELARGLVSMCAQLNEYPYIRYSTSSINCGMLAGKFYEALHEFIQVQTEFDFHGSVDLRDRSTVLLLDRNCDLKQPLLHDPCLESCAFDYLGRQYLRDTYLLELNERNPEWALYRHMPVLSVWTSIQNRLVNCIYKNNDQKYRLTCIAKACTEIFDRIGDSASDEEEAYEKLTSILMLEQMMVTGVEWTVSRSCLCVCVCVCVCVYVCVYFIVRPKTVSVLTACFVVFCFVFEWYRVLQISRRYLHGQWIRRPLVTTS